MEDKNLNTESNMNSEISYIQKLILIFTNPTEAFEKLALKPDWIIPTLLIIVFSIGAAFLVYDLQLDAQKQKFLNNENIPEERKDLILEQLDEAQNSPTRMVQPIAAIVIITFITFAGVAGILLIAGNFILGGKADYKSMLAIYAWGYLVAIPEMLVKIPLTLAKESVHVYTSLALMFDPADAETVIFKLANAVDIFSIWRIVLWSIGFGVVYKLSSEKSFSVVISLYVVYVLAYIGISSLFGGIFG